MPGKPLALAMDGLGANIYIGITQSCSNLSGEIVPLNAPLQGLEQGAKSWYDISIAAIGPVFGKFHVGSVSVMSHVLGGRHCSCRVADETVVVVCDVR